MIHWQKLKRDVWHRCGGKCEACGQGMHRGAAHLHHLTYVRKGHELPKDVIYLCLNCHGLCHPNHIFRPIWEQRRIAEERTKQREKQARQQAKRPAPPLPEKTQPMIECRNYWPRGRLNAIPPVE